MASEGVAFVVVVVVVVEEGAAMTSAICAFLPKAMLMLVSTRPTASSKVRARVGVITGEYQYCAPWVWDG